MARTTSLKKLPLGIDSLTSLQTLSKVVIQRDNGFKISEFKGLKDLQGELSIEGLEKVIDPIETKDANLQQKKGPVDLKLVWGDDTTNEDDVIEKLRPRSKLKTLSINGYRGMTFPSWLGDPSFNQLTTLVLNRCNKCTKLATPGHLTSLQKLGSLRYVSLVGCDSLESYCCPYSVEKLIIKNCDSMTSLSFMKSSSSSSNLKNLELKLCKNIKSISQKHFAYLEEMWLYKCPSMEESFPSCGGLWPPNLRNLTMGELKKPMSEWGLQNYPSSLVELALFGRNSRVVSFGVKGQDYNKSSSCFLLPPFLISLSIYDFEEVDQSLLEVLQHLPRLQHLEIRSCPKIRDVSKRTLSLTVIVW